MYFIICLIKSTALYGVFCLLVGIIVFHINLQDLLQIAFHPDSFKEFFLAYMFWSPALLAVSSLFHFICIKVEDIIKSDHYADNYLKGFMRRFIAIFIKPWTGLFTLIGAEKVIDSKDIFGLLAWIEVILHFVWSVTLLGFIGLGFYNLIK